MKYRKTSSSRRKTYTYVGLDGRKVTLTSGVDGVTEEYIQMLHRMDDNEVYNNNKHAKPPVQDWERPLIEAWKAAHPDEETPGRRTVSLEQITAPNDGETDGEKNHLLLNYCVGIEETVSAEVERLREAVQMLTPEQREVYQRVLINGEPLSSVARELGISPAAVYYRIEVIKKRIKKYF